MKEQLTKKAVQTQNIFFFKNLFIWENIYLKTNHYYTFNFPKNNEYETFSEIKTFEKEKCEKYSKKVFSTTCYIFFQKPKFWSFAIKSEMELKAD